MSLFVASAALCECGTRVVVAGAVLFSGNKFFFPGKWSKLAGQVSTFHFGQEDL